MKVFVIVLFALAFYSELKAQDATNNNQPTAERMNEIGIKLEFSGALEQQQNFIGVQLKHFGKKNIGYRLFAGYGQVTAYNTYVTPVPIIAPDSLIHKSTSVAVNMPIIGGGIEGQHPLYKHVYMLASIEGKIGYGGNNIDSAIWHAMPNTTLPPYYGFSTLITDKPGPYVNMLYLAVSASVGIKAQLKRIAAGLEFPFVVSSANVIKGDNSNNGYIGIGISFFANYRF